MKHATVFNRLIAFSAALCVLFGLYSCTNDVPESSEKATYTVTFDYADKNNTVKTKKVTEGETVKPPKTPETDGYKFNAWFYLGTEFDFSTPVTKNITLFANWFDLSKEYRVTTGVKKYFQNRGTAAIKDSASGTTKRVTEGDEVVFVATPGKGYKFSGWVNENGKTVSKDAEYVIPHITKQNTINGELILVAQFVYSDNVDGLDDENNELLWNAIQNTEFEDFTFEITVKDHKTNLTNLYFVSVNQSAGLAEIKVNEQNDDGVTLNIVHYYFKAENDEIKVYKQKDGNLVEENGISKSTISTIKSLLSKSTTGDSGEEASLQTQLSVYNFFKNNLSKSENGLNFNVSISKYLKEISNRLNENKDKTLGQAIYPNVKQAYDELQKSLNGSGSGTPSISFDNMTLQDIIDMAKTLGFIGDVNVDEKVNSYIDEFKLLCDAEGLSFDAEAKKQAYAEMKNLKIPALIEKLNETPLSYGSLSSIPSDAQLTVAVTYMMLSDFKLGDVADLVVTRNHIKGTPFDVTNYGSDFSGAFVNGNITIVGNEIRSVTSEKTFGTESDGTTIKISLLFEGTATDPVNGGSAQSRATN